MMNRAMRRKMNKEERRNPNSKQNFKTVGNYNVPVSQIVHDENLKECDNDVVKMYKKVFQWQKNRTVKNNMSKAIILSAMDYLDSLCSLRFDITPVEDKVLIRNTMYYISNMTNYFLGLCSGDEDISFNGMMINARANGDRDVKMPVPTGAHLYENYLLPSEDAIDDMYAGFVVKHAYELAPCLAQTKPSDISGDEDYVFEVLNMVVSKIWQLNLEAQVVSNKFAINLEN